MSKLWPDNGEGQGESDVSLQQFADTLPPHAKDLRLNVASVLNDQSIPDRRKYGLLLACAHGTGYRPLVVAVEAEVASRLDEPHKNAARAAAASMAMSNVYDRFVHLASNPVYGALPSKLRTGAIAALGVDKGESELFSLAVSAMNGCGICIDGHERVLIQQGVKPEAIQAAARIAAITRAVATVHATL